MPKRWRACDAAADGLAANLIPVTLGNILGGAGLGLAYWYIYLKKPKA